MNGTHETEWIERYLLGELTEAERQQFETRLQADDAFRHEVDLQRTIVHQARQVAREDLRAKLRGIHRQVAADARPADYEAAVEGDHNEVPRRGLWQRWGGPWAIAASVAGLLLVALALYFSLRRTSTDAPLAQQPAVQPVLSRIALETNGAAPDMGFSGGQSGDTTAAILIYPESGPRAYQFDDTLRLYGSFRAASLRLRYDQASERYTLVEDSTRYVLRRYRPKARLE